MNYDQVERERKRTLSSWQAFKRFAVRTVESYKIDGTHVIVAVDREIEVATKQVNCFNEMNESVLAGLELLPGLPASLVETRKNLRWTQAMLGSEVGLTYQQISRYERSNYATISLSKAIEINQVLQSEVAQRIKLQRISVNRPQTHAPGSPDPIRDCPPYQLATTDLNSS